MDVHQDPEGSLPAAVGGRAMAPKSPAAQQAGIDALLALSRPPVPSSLPAAAGPPAIYLPRTLWRPVSRDGREELTDPLQPDGADAELPARPNADHPRVSRRDSHRGRGGAIRLAAGEVTPGALNPRYDIPDCFLNRKAARGIAITSCLLAVLVVRYVMFIHWYPAFWPLAAIWAVPLASMIFQWIASWLDRPVPPDRREQDWLDRLHVTVSIPCYNEDPALLDRCLYALMNQTRRPQQIDVVDDGSKENYAQLETYWAGWWGQTVIRWIRQPNAGKKGAQAPTFADAPEADIFVIIDSDTALDRRALDEGLRPFADRGVSSVAGIELAMNARKNWLTRTVSVRSLFFQMLPCAAQSAVGDVLINRGAYFLIRAQIVRDYLDAYLNETFLGRPIRLGDDAALTLFARSRGKTVQQSTAFALTMYPETLSHHVRQWIRWMRGSTIRTIWRVRYLSPATFGWWFAVMGIYSFFVSTLYPILLIALLPESVRAIEYVVMVMIVWGYIYGLRSLSVRRSDESRWFQLGSLLSYPAVLLWGLFVLRPLRLYGTCTFLKQDWVTRTHGAEVFLTPAEEVAA